MAEEVSEVRKQIKELKLVVEDRISEEDKDEILVRLLRRGVVTDKCLLDVMRKIATKFLPNDKGEIHLTAADRLWAVRLLEECEGKQ